MPRRGAAITQADVARTIRAAKKEGAVAVEVRPDGRIIVQLAQSCAQESNGPPVAGEGEIIL